MWQKLFFPCLRLEYTTLRLSTSINVDITIESKCGSSSPIGTAVSLESQFLDFAYT